MTTNPILMPRYRVRVAIPLDAATPAEAARKFVDHINRHGFGSLTYNVEDLVEDESYIATLDTWATVEHVMDEMGDGEGTIWVQSTDPERVAEGDEVGPFKTMESALSRLSLLDINEDEWEVVDRATIDTEFILLQDDEPVAPETTEEPEPEPAEQGKCARCSTESSLNHEGLCGACVEDVMGAPR